MRFGIEFGSYPSDLDRRGVVRDFTERAQLAQRSNYERSLSPTTTRRDRSSGPLSLL